MQRLQQQIKELQQYVENMKPEGNFCIVKEKKKFFSLKKFSNADIIQRLEEENQTNQYLVNEKLPKEISIRRKAIQELQKVVSQSAIEKSDLDEIKKKVNH